MMTWKKLNTKSMRSPINSELVTGRVLLVNKKVVINISIGKTVADILSFHKRDRVNVYFNKHDKNTFLIKKCLKVEEGYQLNESSNFLRFNFRFFSQEDFKLSQTISMDYDIFDDKSLLVNCKKIKWSN